MASRGVEVGCLDLDTLSAGFPTPVKPHSRLLREQVDPQRTQRGLPDMGRVSSTCLHHAERPGTLQVDFLGKFPTISYVPLSATSTPVPYGIVSLPQQCTRLELYYPGLLHHMSSYDSWRLWRTIVYGFWVYTLCGRPVDILAYFGCIFTRRDVATPIISLSPANHDQI